MQIQRQQVVDFLRTRSLDDYADRAEAELPDTVDSEKDRGLLATFGVESEDLANTMMGGRSDPSGLEPASPGRIDFEEHDEPERRDERT